MGFWEGIKTFFTTNVVWLAVLAVLTAIATTLECSNKIKTPIQSLIRHIKKKKADKIETFRLKEEREKKEEENIASLLRLYKTNATQMQTLNNAVTAIQGDVANIKKQQDKQRETLLISELDRIRWEILDFANSCRYERKHTRNEFEHIISLKEKYELLLGETKQPNDVFKAEYEYIMELYKICLRDNSFL